MVRTTSDRLRIGIVGAGSIVRERHLPGLKALPGVEVVAVCNRTHESGLAVASEFGIRQVLSDWHKLVAMDEVDAVLIGTHPHLHHAITLAALGAGKHVFCQARMALDSRQAREMHEAAERSGLKTMLCPSPYGIKGHKTMKRLIADGSIGEVYSIVVRSMTDVYSDPDNPVHWRQIGAISGYNTLSLGIVVETLHRWFGYAAAVAAIDKLFIGERPSVGGHGRGQVDRPDVVTIGAEMESGAIASLHFSGVSRHAGPSMIEAYGSCGSLRYNLDADEIECASAGGRGMQPVQIRPEDEGRWRVEEEFIDLVREDRPVAFTTFAEGVKYMEFTEAVFLSASGGRKVSLPLA